MRAHLTALVLLASCSGGAVDSGSPATSTDSGTATVSADAGPDLTALVGEPITLDGSGSSGVTVTWDTGDGTRLDGAVVSHSYTEPGRYTAVVQAVGADGRARTDAALVTATLPPTAVSASWSSTVALDAARDQLWVVDPEGGTVAVLTTDGTARESLALCAGPRTLAVAGDVVAVACEDDDTLVLIDAAELALAEVVDLGAGARPYGVAGREGTWWVSLQGPGQVAEVTDGAVTLHTVGADPRGVALTADDRVLASRWRGAAGVLQVGADPLELELDDRGDSDTTTGGVLTLVDQLVPSPDGTRAWLAGHHANTLRGEHLSGEALTFETSLRAALATVDLDSGADDLADRKQFDERGHCSALVPSPEGALLYVLHPGTATVSVLDAETLDQAGSILGVGRGGAGLAISEDGATLYVHAWLDREVHAYDVADLSTNPSPTWTLATVASEPLDAEVLRGKQLFHDSSDTRLARSGYVACAHCHPDGRDDGLTWDFTDRGEGLRQTTSLEGRAGTGQGRVHWSGNFDEIQDFEHDLRGPFGGTGLLSDEDWAETDETLGEPKAGRSEDLDALAAYVSSLDRAPPSPWAEADDGTGATAFEAAGCESCHPAPAYTDSTLADPLRHDVGTLHEGSGQRLGAALDGLDTPTLLGVWATAPYLHDGSAETLEAAIAAHDSAADLDEDTVAAVALFVRGL